MAAVAEPRLTVWVLDRREPLENSIQTLVAFTACRGKPQRPSPNRGDGGAGGEEVEGEGDWAGETET